MIDTITEIDEKTAIFNGKTCQKYIEQRGRRFKFWLDDDLLFKANLNNSSFENNGEVLSYLLAKKLGLDAVPYKLAKYVDKDKHEITGVVCPNYRKMLEGEEEEISGNILINLCKMYSSETRFSTAPRNTVNFYTDFIAAVFPKSDIRKIRTDLLKMSLFDYITNQRDRHSGNITFLKIGEKLILCPLYDNGAAYWSNYGPRKISNISLALHQTRNKEDLYFETLKGSTMFGVKTPQSRTMMNEKHQYVEVFCSDNSYIEYEKEIAKEIVNNVELAEFYAKVKSVNISSILEAAEREGCEIPAEHKDIIEDVHAYKIERIDSAVAQYENMDQTECFANFSHIQGGPDNYE